MDLQDVMLSKMSQKKTNTPLYVEFIYTENMLMVIRGGREVGKMGEDAQKLRAPVIREVSLRDVTYSVLTLVNKTVMYV